MAERIEVDIAVIGGGSGGLVVAAGASQLGAKVALVERHKMGGDCLNYGCVPSKALIAAGRTATAIREAGRFGIRAGAPETDYAAVRDHVKGVIAAIAPNDSVERFTGLGVRVILAAARFTAPDELQAGETTIRARRFVIATGSSPAVPPIPGLDTVPYLTNETIFDLDRRPDHLIVIGGGPIGLELAQAHRRLGAPVTVLEMFKILPKDDPELADIVRRQILDDGIVLREGVKVVGIEGDAARPAVVIEENGVQGRVEGSHLLLAAGRRANVRDLGLEAAGVKYSPKGIEVDSGLRTSNPRIFAIGDVTGGYQFTHMAGYHAGIVIRRALFRLPAKTDGAVVPWVTYTEPELASVGASEAEARQRHGEIRILRWPFHENDRAQAERDTHGMVKVVTTKRGRILGAAIVGAHAGELLQPWILAINKKLTARDMSGMIAPYPTLGEVNKRAAGSFFTPSLFSERTRKIVRFLARFG